MIPLIICEILVVVVAATALVVRYQRRRAGSFLAPPGSF